MKYLLPHHNDLENASEIDLAATEDILQGKEGAGVGELWEARNCGSTAVPKCQRLRDPNKGPGGLSIWKMAIMMVVETPSRLTRPRCMEYFTLYWL